MADWGFQRLTNGLWGARGFYPKGESAPQDEEILGQIIQITRKDGSSQTKRITGIEGWSTSPQGWASVRCEFEDAEPEKNGANPNLPSAPPSAQGTGIPLYTPDGVYRINQKEGWWQPSPEILAAQEEFQRVQHEKMLNGIPTTSHTIHQVENGFPEKCGCQFCRINDPFYGQGPKICTGKYCQFCRNMEKRFGKKCKWLRR